METPDRKEKEMKHYLMLCMSMFVVLLSACSSAATPIEEGKAGSVTPSSTLATPSLMARPLDAVSSNMEVNDVLTAVASGDPQQLIKLFGFTTTACKTVNALGGPPPCRAGEAEGTMVEVLPVLGGEGSYLRKDEINDFPGLNVAGVYAVYQVSESAYAEEYFPAGDYGIMLVGPENEPGVVLQVKDGKIIRIDYLFDRASYDTILARDSSGFVLEPIK